MAVHYENIVYSRISAFESNGIASVNTNAVNSRHTAYHPRRRLSINPLIHHPLAIVQRCAKPKVSMATLEMLESPFCTFNSSGHGTSQLVWRNGSRLPGVWTMVRSPIRQMIRCDDRRRVRGHICEMCVMTIFDS